jgi:plasmid maintenance system antidote protein VapI
MQTVDHAANGSAHGKLCGNGPRLWITMQAAYDLWNAQRTIDVFKIPTLEHV